MEKTGCAQQLYEASGSTQENLLKENGRASVSLVRGRDHCVTGIVTAGRKKLQHGGHFITVKSTFISVFKAY